MDGGTFVLVNTIISCSDWSKLQPVRRVLGRYQTPGCHIDENVLSFFSFKCARLLSSSPENSAPKIHVFACRPQASFAVAQKSGSTGPLPLLPGPHLPSQDALLRGGGVYIVSQQLRALLRSYPAIIQTAPPQLRT